MRTVIRLGLSVAFKGIQEDRAHLEIDAWMPSKVKAISPAVDWLMRQIEDSNCVAGHETAVELALREALSNAVVHGNHGNQSDSEKLVHRTSLPKTPYSPWRKSYPVKRTEDSTNLPLCLSLGIAVVCNHL